MDKVRIGIIGLGWMGKLHAKYLQDIDSCKICAVCDKDKNTAVETAALYGARVYPDYRELLKDEEVNTVYVVTPQQYHFEIAKAVMETGRHMLCEKPLALNEEEVNELRRLSRDYPGKIMIDFPERFSVAAQEAMEEINNGAIGDVQFMRGNFRFSMKNHAQTHGAWVFDKSKGGGLILESSVHLWDAVRYMTGQEVVSVGAVAHNNVAADYEDSFACIAHLSGGGIACIDMNGWMPKESDTDKRFEIMGSVGSIYLDEYRNFITLQSELGIENNPGMLTKGQTHKDVMWHSKIAGGVKRLNEHFADCIIKDKQPLTGIEDGARACEITWAVLQSLSTGRIEEVSYGR